MVWQQGRLSVQRSQSGDHKQQRGTGGCVCLMQLPEVLCFDHLPIYCLLIYLFYKGQEKWTEMFQRSELKCFISFSFSFRQIHNMILQQQKYWIMTGRNIYVCFQLGIYWTEYERRLLDWSDSRLQK